MKLKFRRSKKPIKLVFFNPSKFPSRSRAEWKIIDRNPFGDTDRDGVPNWFDCKPLNRKKQGWVGKDDIREIKESESNKRLRLKRGLTKIKTIDALEFKNKYEEQHSNKLDWNPDRLKQALKRNEDDAYPEVYFGSDKIEVSDGRHRISAAAERGQKIKVAYEDEAKQELKDDLKD